MTRLWALAILILLAPAPTGAAPLPVRSGEHDTFSRLVVPIPAGTTWRLSRQDRTARLTMPGAEFDTRGVFDLIPRTRLTGIRQSKPGKPLILYLNCDCPVRAYVESGNHLVMDIADPAPLARAAMAGDTERSYRFSTAAPATPMPLPVAIGQLADTEPTRPTPPQSRQPDGPPDSRARLLGDLSHPDTAETLNLSELRLLDQIGRAARQGLLVPRPVAQQIADAPDTAHPAPDRHPSTAPPEPPEHVPYPLQPNLHAVTSADRDNAHIKLHQSDSADSSSCIPSDAVAVADWANGQDFATGLGALRGALYSDIGEIQNRAAIALAEFYIHFGFGQEALGVLSLAHSAGKRGPLIASIARLMDADHTGGLPVFRDQAGCTTDIALWAFLARPVPGPRPEQAETQAIRQAFAKLPLHLRVHLGPRLSRRFLQLGDSDSAANILRSIELAASEHVEGAQLAKAEIDLHRGASETAKTALNDVIGRNSEYSPEALIALIETSFGDGGDMRPDLADLAAAYAAEFDGTPLSQHLKRAEILALVHQNAFGTALLTLRETENAGPWDAADRTRDEVMMALTDRADDLTFLRLAFQELAQGADRFAPATGTAMATRLIGLGFADAAARLLDHPASERKAPDRRLLRARIALMDAKPNRAMVELAGLHDPEAERLRAMALSLIGEHDAAADSYLRADDPENAARTLWANGAWDRLPPDAPDRFETSATLARGLTGRPDAPGAGNPAGPLAEARTLLAASARARADISQLLETLPGPSQESGN